MMSSCYDVCGLAFNLSHALGCRKGELVNQHNNEMRDTLGDLTTSAYRDVVRESIVQNGDDIAPALITDLGNRGVWLPQIEALYDISVTDADVPSYLSHSVVCVLISAEEKKQKYVTASEVCCASSSPFVMTLGCIHNYVTI